MSWDLLDRLGSTVAQSTGGSITQLASYSDWGEQSFESSGWSALSGFTGRASDPTLGLTSFGARSYDPQVGSWMAPDSWPGLVGQPKSLSGYSYVGNDPVRYLDPDGHRLSEPSADARAQYPIYWIDQQREAEANRIENERVARAMASGHGVGYRPEPAAFVDRSTDSPIVQGRSSASVSPARRSSRSPGAVPVLPPTMLGWRLARPRRRRR